MFDIFGFSHHNHPSPWDDAPPWAKELRATQGIILKKIEAIMSTIEDFEGTLVTIDGQVTKVKADVETLLAKLAAIPAGGLTTEQQAAIDAAVVHAQSIATSLGAIDLSVNPAAPAG